MLVSKLGRHFFYDLDIEKMDDQKNRRIIIERVFSMGDLDDLKLIFDYYGTDVIKKEIIRAGNLDKKTLNFASIYFQIPKDKFRCYTKMQSNQAHWNY